MSRVPPAEASDGRVPDPTARRWIVLLSLLLILLVAASYLPMLGNGFVSFDDDEYIYESLKHGADGFLLKGASINELVSAIEVIHAGGAIVDTGVSTKVVSLFKRMAKADFLLKVDKEDCDDLSDNEVKIMQAIGRGLSNKEIAKHLNFTEGTVRNYISSILKKMDLRDRTQIAIFAIQSSIMLRTFED